MAFFEGLGKKISEAAGSAAVKAKDLAGEAADKAKLMAEIAKINSDIHSTQKQMDKTYFELGKAVFGQEKANEESIYAEQIEKIKDFQNTIIEYQKKLQEIKEKDNTPPADSQNPEPEEDSGDGMNFQA